MPFSDDDVSSESEESSRIKNVLPNIIHHNQTGYVKDRYMGETLRSVFDIMDFTAKESIPGLMIFIDF